MDDDLQNATSLMQPVLKWATFYEEWYVVSEWVMPGVYHYSTDPYFVDPGDRIDAAVGSSNCNSQGQCDWGIRVYVNGNLRRSLGIRAHDLVYRYVLQAVLEHGAARAPEECTDLPNDPHYTWFTNTAIFMPSTQGPNVPQQVWISDWDTGIHVDPGEPNCNYNIGAWPYAAWLQYNYP
jgi:hypothetical protein